MNSTNSGFFFFVCILRPYVLGPLYNGVFTWVIAFLMKALSSFPIYTSVIEMWRNKNIWKNGKTDVLIYSRWWIFFLTPVFWLPPEGPSPEVFLCVCLHEDVAIGKDRKKMCFLRCKNTDLTPACFFFLPPSLSLSVGSLFSCLKEEVSHWAIYRIRTNKKNRLENYSLGL